MVWNWPVDLAARPYCSCGQLESPLARTAQGFQIWIHLPFLLPPHHDLEGDKDVLDLCHVDPTHCPHHAKPDRVLDVHHANQKPELVLLVHHACGKPDRDRDVHRASTQPELRLEHKAQLLQPELDVIHLHAKPDAEDQVHHIRQTPCSDENQLHLHAQPDAEGLQCHSHHAGQAMCSWLQQLSGDPWDLLYPCYRNQHSKTPIVERLMELKPDRVPSSMTELPSLARFALPH